VQAILSVTVPFFALVLCGYFAARHKLLPESAIPGLNSFVLFFALPCMLFRFGASLPLARLLDPLVLAVYSAVQLLLVFFTVSITLSARVGRKDAAFGALVAAFPNSGFMGVPLLAALLGPAAAGVVIPCILVDMVLTSSLCIAVAMSGQDATQRTAAADGTEDAGDAGQAGAAALRSLRGVLTNPLPWAIALGGVASVTGLRLPGPVDAMVRMLADAASPVALFTIGAVLWRAGQHAHSRTPPALYLPVALFKLLLHPLLVLLVAGAARALGAPLSLFQILALTLTAALPSASNVSLLAERYQADNGRVARIIMSSTVLAFFSFTLLAWLLGISGTGAR
jgi:malonate transporter and related proteins